MGGTRGGWLTGTSELGGWGEGVVVDWNFRIQIHDRYHLTLASDVDNNGIEEPIINVEVVSLQ